MVQVGGLAPPRPEGPQILSLVCLLIPTYLHIKVPQNLQSLELRLATRILSDAP